MTNARPVDRDALFLPLLVAAVIGLVAVVPQPVWAAAPESKADVTFTKDIVPILQRSCQKCHRAGGAAPMPLVEYEEVRPWVRSIKNRTGARQMPPWFIDKNIGIQRYKDDPSLTDAEITALATWVDNGAPRGNPGDLPPPLEWPADGWTYGVPDLVVPSPEGIVEPDAADWFGEWGHTPTGLTEDRYIKAIEVKEVRLEEGPPTDLGNDGRADLGLFVVHHSVMGAEHPEDARRALDCGNASSCSRVDEDAFRLTYELGQNATVYPDEVGVRLPAGSVINFNSMHLHSVGREVRARLDVGFTLHPKGYTPKYDQRSGGLQGATQYDYEFDVPSNDNDVMRDGFQRLTESAKLLTFEPHLHSSGKRMCVEAIYPNNAREMLSCADYDHNWVKVYVYEDDVAPLLPAGTLVHVMAWYDNSVTNKNVVDPRNWKGWGNRSIDDMLVSITRMVNLTEDEFQAEVAARGVDHAFATSQDQQ